MADKNKDSGLHTTYQWLEAAARDLDITEEVLKPLVPLLLDLTSDVAHGPARPAAPLTAFLVGVAAGRHTSSTTSPAGRLTDERAGEFIDETKRAIGIIDDLLERYESGSDKKDS